MEDLPTPPPKNDEVKQTILILLSMFAALCVFVFCAMAGVAYGINIIDKNQKVYVVTQQVNATSTAVAQTTKIAGYEFFDDFHDNGNLWTSGHEYNKYWYGNLNVRDGVYAWDIERFYASKTVYSWRGYDIGSVKLKDFDMSVDAKLATPQARHMCYGVAFRSSNLGQYIFSVCDEQTFFVKYNDGEDEDVIIMPWMHSEIIRSGDWNTLAVNARGDHFILSINNLVVYEFTDTHLSQGKVLLLLNAHDDIPGTIMFDNFGLQSQ